MNDRTNAPDPIFLKNSMAAFLKIGAVLVLLIWCFQILAPFLNIIVWAAIMSVAVYPLHLKLAGRLGGKPRLSATLVILVGLSILVVPSLLVAGSTVDFVKVAGSDLQQGGITIPPPTDQVKDWPLIGTSVFDAWSSASQNLAQELERFEPQLAAAGKRLLGLVSHGAETVIVFAIAVLIAGSFLLSADKHYEFCCRIASGLAGPRGQPLVDLTVATIRSVAKGVLGVALIQALMAQAIMMFWGVPGAGIWAGLVLTLAIMQLPPILVLGPVAIWAFATAEPLSASVFLVLAFVVSFSDAALKPLFLGRGMEIPMLVILLGAIGGAISFGIIGLFIGSIVLAVGYTVLTAWMEDEPKLESR